VPIDTRPIAALRAQLSGNSADHKRLLAGFSGRDDRVAYSALVHAAFLEAVSRRFTKQSGMPEIVEYVGDVRSKSDAIASAVDPRVGEQLILEVLGRARTDGADTRASSTAMLFLVTALIADEHLTGDELDQFIAKAKETADQLLGGS
jgi:hypothetical protein